MIQHKDKKMNSQKKITVYFGDLVHNYLSAGSYMFPLNIGFLAAYARKEYGNLLNIELFKYPQELIDAIQKRPPDILSLSNYTWNSHINGEVAKFAKSINPDIFVVFGGPDINLTTDGYRNFFTTHPHVDFYVLCEGEKGFSNIIQKYIEVNGNLPKAKEEPVNGVVINDEDQILEGKILDRIEDLNIIPSPYLTGILDKFFDYKLIPIIETNRGCPFSCIFCAQGKMSRHIVKYFDLNRVMDELVYIANHVHHTSILCFADANFGIHQRDIEIGKKIKSLGETKGYPHACTINWVKTRNAIKVAEEMGQSVYLVSSLQSLDPEVLKIIKRHNIDPKLFREIVDHVNEKGGVSGTEIILGLPGETKQSHAYYLRHIFEWGVSYIICYNCLLINGSELALPEFREKYQIKTKFRLLDSAYGRYGPVSSFEYEEGIRSTSTMSEEEILFFRPVHWLIQFFWNYRFYFPILKLCFNRGINPYDFMVTFLDQVDENAPGTVKNIVSEFKAEAKNEWFDSPEQLRNYYETHFDILADGNVGKMNSKYVWKAVLECKPGFDAYVEKIAASILPEYPELCHDLVRYSSNALIKFEKMPQFEEDKIIHFGYEIRQWIIDGYQGMPERKDVSYRFSLTAEKKHTLDILLEQYKHKNINVTLRKMSEHIKFPDLYYDICEL
jgi:radical SAM superfamily enzyme YgiQ (UPF0313 family)